MYEEDFQIDLFTFWWNYSTDNAELNEKIWRFLDDHNLSFPIKTLYSAFIERVKIEDSSFSDRLLNKLTHKHAWETNFLDGTDQKEMYNQLKRDFHYIDNPESYSVQNRRNVYYSPGYEDHPRYGFVGVAILNQPLQLTYSEASHQPLFRELFTQILAKTKWPGQFLQYHLENAFNTNFPNYHEFLALIVSDFKVILKERINFLKLWIENTSKKNSLPQSVEKNSTVKIKEELKLINIRTASISQIAREFQGFFSNSFDLLEMALEGKPINKKLVFAGPAIQLIGAFWTLHRAGLISNDKNHLATWIAQTFSSTQKQKSKSIEVSSASRCLKQNINPSKKKITGIEDLVSKIQPNHS
jgi:hypothetical protein